MGSKMIKWKTVIFRNVTYDNYLVYEDGKVFSKKTQRYMKPGHNNKGYAFIHLPGLRGSAYIHHIVAESFLGLRPKGMTIDHIDGNKLNNHVSNLEYVTNAENMRRARAMGTFDFSKKPVIGIDIKTGDSKEWASLAEAADEVAGIKSAYANISSCIAGRKTTAYGMIWQYKEQS